MVEKGEKSDEFEIDDVEDFRHEKDIEFSHQALVMIAMKKAIEYGTMEQVQGVYLEDVDRKTGAIKVTYRQDVRKAFIESVRTSKMIMICDFDEEATKKINGYKDKKTKKHIDGLIDKINNRKEELIKEQETWWEELKPSERNNWIRRGVTLIKGHFSIDLPFMQTYLFEELNVYREIFEELTLLTKRVKFYKTKMYEA